MQRSRVYMPSLGNSPSSSFDNGSSQNSTADSGVQVQLRTENERRVYFQNEYRLTPDPHQRSWSNNEYAYYLPPLNDGQLDNVNAEALLRAFSYNQDSINLLNNGQYTIRAHDGATLDLCLFYFKPMPRIEIGDDINSIEITPSNEFLMQAVFAQVMRCGYFAPQPVIYRENDHNGSLVYVIRNITFAMYAERKVGVDRPDRAYVVGDELGSGGFGVVYDIKGVIKRVPVNGRLEYKSKNKSKVAKFVYNHRPLCGAYYSRPKVDHECAMMRKLGYFGSVRHSQIKLKDQTAGVVTIKRFTGRELYELLDSDRYSRIGKRFYEDDARNEDRPRYRRQSIIGRFLLSIACAKALSLVHARKIKHLDIKPENILADDSGIVTKVKIIDTGLSEDADTKCDSKGSPHYIAPESFSGLTVKSDIYSLGRVLGIVWGDEEFYQLANDGAMTYFTFFKQLQENKDRKLDLFNMIELDTVNEPGCSIAEIIYGLIAYDQVNRKNLDDAIKRFQELYAEYFIDASYEELFQAGSIDEILTDAQYFHEVEIPAMREAAACACQIDRAFRALNGQEVTIDLVAKLQKQLKQINIENSVAFSRSRLAQTLFRQILGFKCLEDDGLNSMAKIKARIDYIFNRFVAGSALLGVEINRLGELVAANSGNNDKATYDLRDVFHGCNVIELKIKSCPPDLDEILDVSDHVIRKTAKLRACIENYEQVVESKKMTLKV